MATRQQRIVVVLPRELPDGSIEDVEVTLPSRWAICDCCRGSGGSSAYLGAITSDQWHQDWDVDERDAYMRGEYDRRCEPCHGSGKVFELDPDATLTELQREAIAHRCEDEREEALERSILAAERRLLGDY